MWVTKWRLSELATAGGEEDCSFGIAAERRTIRLGIGGRGGGFFWGERLGDSTNPNIWKRTTTSTQVKNKSPRNFF